jgi:tRNA 2-thiocytidine biosynthesis protein TtcA
MKTSRFKTIEERESFLANQLRRASQEFGILTPDRPVLVALSGGRDSLCLLHLLVLFQRKYAPALRLLPVTVLDGVQTIDTEALGSWVNSYGLGLDCIVAPEIAEELASRNGRKACYVCSRRRRRKLCEFADQHGAREIALGHHRLDFLETFMLSLLRGGKLGCMRPNQPLFDDSLALVRPMVFVEDDHLTVLAERRALPIQPKSCPYGKETDRTRMRRVLRGLFEQFPDSDHQLFAALQDPAETPLMTPPRRDA